MAKGTQLPTIYDGCTPRKEVIRESLKLEVFAANLSIVALNKGPDIYKDPELFFANTYPTDGLKTTIKEVFGRLTSTFDGSPVIKLETGLGGGKTHTLIALYHLAKHGSSIKSSKKFIGNLVIKQMNVATLVGTELSVGGSGKKPKTLWGEMAFQLKKKEGYKVLETSDKNMTSPGERALRDLFGKDKCLILIDELAPYLAKASGIHIEKTKTNLGEQTGVFLQELTQVAASMDNVELVITALDEKSIFKERTKEIKDILATAIKQEEIRKNIKDSKEILTRIVRTLEPTKGEEFAHIIRHRLFKKIDEDVKKDVVEAYLSGYHDEGVKDYLPSFTQDPDYEEVMLKSYPFHPDVIDILRTKTSSIENFNKTRGVLRLLSLIIKNVWENKIDSALIHPYHVDFYNDNIRSELINRLDMTELKPAIEEDLANKDKETRAELVDKRYSEPYGSRITTVVLLHSLTQKLKADVHKGANTAEIHLALCRPGLEPKTIENVLEDLDDTWFYFGPEGQYYVTGLNPRLTKIIEKTKEQIEQTKINQEVESWIRKVFHSKKHFKHIFFPSSPSAVHDDTEQTKLIVMHYSECSQKHGSVKIPELVRKIFEETGSQGKPRSFINNIVFLVPDEERIKQMEAQARTYLALRQLIQDYEGGTSYLSALTTEQKKKLKNMRSETELFLKVAVIIVYKHLIIPSSQSTISESGTKRPLRVISMRDTERDIEDRLKEGEEAEESIVSFLRGKEVARTVDDNPLSSERILDGLWKKTADSMDGDEFKKMFYKNPIAGIHFSDELIRKSMKEGIKKGRWLAVVEGNFYDKDNWQGFNPSFTTDTVLTIEDSPEGEKLYETFHCSKCGKKKNECTCEKGEKKEPERGPEPPPLPKSKSFQNSSIERMGKSVGAWIADEKISKVNSIRFKARSRNGLSVLSKALRQFRTDFIARYDLEGNIHRPEKDMTFRIVYKGDEKNFNNLRTALFDFMAKDEFDSSQLFINVEFPKGYEAEKFVQDLGEKIAPFTTGNAYDIDIAPLED